MSHIEEAILRRYSGLTLIGFAALIKLLVRYFGQREQ